MPTIAECERIVELSGARDRKGELVGICAKHGPDLAKSLLVVGQVLGPHVDWNALPKHDADEKVYIVLTVDEARELLQALPKD